MWEIAKTSADAAKEFDRTMDFIGAVISALRADANLGQGFGSWQVVEGVGVRVRRGPIGVLLGMAPFNYPLNEMYAILMPALLMGNTAVLKLPNVGGLVHMLTARAFAKALPPGVINFVSGSGRTTAGPIMQSGLVDVLGFIGGTGGADALMKQHPAPHRLKVFAQLAANNLGVVLADADMDTAVAQCVAGATSYNGQRCTAIKLIMVHESIADEFVARLVERVSQLRAGMPWEPSVAITPLPEVGKAKYLEGLISDALSKGAVLANAKHGGGAVAGSLFTPAVLDRVTPEMRVFGEEQFGPVVPIARFKEVGEVQAAIKNSWNGQQAAIFTTNTETATCANAATPGPQCRVPTASCAAHA
jgi:glyceraldehyde-3-phosphate dehydrogenase (NADP+)